MNWVADSIWAMVASFSIVSVYLLIERCQHHGRHRQHHDGGRK